ncbi:MULTISPECIES: universal stress protein [unclassified Cupriavidus]|uniref:universal stress protein n=1 Tax=unclassified Cupriavidus TaxID=2640874 RepID=UPI0010F6B022|nr:MULTISPECIES: universal stress protein [unclassified Cupriavidus]MWL89745.1 universal stress protein [Cupriavidus sp. SW-Y-13]
MYKRILIAIDGGPSSEQAIFQAVGLAKELGAEVKILFVVDDSEFFFEPAYVNPQEVLRGMLEVGQQALARAARRFENAGVRALTELAEKPVSPGDISGTIVSHAEQWPAELVVMGTHGRRGVRRMIMGSVSEGVVAKSAKPVLLIRGDTVH